MTNEILYLKMQELEQKHFGSTFDDVFINMPKGPLKDAADALYKYVVLQEQLIHNLENELDELKIPNPEPKRFFFSLTSRSQPIQI